MRVLTLLIDVLVVSLAISGLLTGILCTSFTAGPVGR